jgi:hypothetical protein
MASAALVAVVTSVSERFLHPLAPIGAQAARLGRLWRGNGSALGLGGSRGSRPLCGLLEARIAQVPQACHRAFELHSNCDLRRIGRTADMDRQEFEKLRDLSGKRITAEIVLRSKKDRRGVQMSGPVPIESSNVVLAHLYVEHNVETDSKSINVMMAGIGPICRLEVDSRVHRPAGRSHKHSLRMPDCPTKNLPIDVMDRPELTGASLEVVFEEFCRMAHIEFTGGIKVLE